MGAEVWFLLIAMICAVLVAYCFTRTETFETSSWSLISFVHQWVFVFPGIWIGLNIFLLWTFHRAIWWGLFPLLLPLAFFLMETFEHVHRKREWRFLAPVREMVRQQIEKEGLSEYEHYVQVGITRHPSCVFIRIIVSEEHRSLFTSVVHPVQQVCRQLPDFQRYQWEVVVLKKY